MEAFSKKNQFKGILYEICFLSPIYSILNLMYDTLHLFFTKLLSHPIFYLSNDIKRLNSAFLEAR